MPRSIAGHSVRNTSAKGKRSPLCGAGNESSTITRRRMKAVPPRAMPRRKGIRQPQASNAAGSSSEATSTAHAGAQQRAARGAHTGDAAEQAAPPRTAALDQEYDGGGELAADRKALEQPEPEKQERGRRPDHGIGRQQADGHGRDGHQPRREHQRPLAAEAVPDMAEQRAADGAHEEGGGEDAEGRGEGHHRIAAREEIAPEDRGEIAIGREIVPFEGIADRARQHLAELAGGCGGPGKLARISRNGRRIARLHARQPRPRQQDSPPSDARHSLCQFT